MCIRIQPEENEMKMYNTNKNERSDEDEEKFAMMVDHLRDLSRRRGAERLLYHLSLILFADDRRRLDDDERERALRSCGREFCRVWGRALAFRRPILIVTRP